MTKDHTIAHQIALARAAATSKTRSKPKVEISSSRGSGVLAHIDDSQRSAIGAAGEVESCEMSSAAVANNTASNSKTTSPKTSTSPAPPRRKPGPKKSCASTPLRKHGRYILTDEKLNNGQIPRGDGFLISDVAMYLGKDKSHVAAIARKLGFFRYAKGHSKVSGPVTYEEAKELIRYVRTHQTKF